MTDTARITVSPNRVLFEGETPEDAAYFTNVLRVLVAGGILPFAQSSRTLAQVRAQIQETADRQWTRDAEAIYAALRNHGTSATTRELAQFALERGALRQSNDPAQRTRLILRGDPRFVRYGGRWTLADGS